MTAYTFANVTALVQELATLLELPIICDTMIPTGEACITLKNRPSGLRQRVSIGSCGYLPVQTAITYNEACATLKAWIDAVRAYQLRQRALNAPAATVHIGHKDIAVG